MNKTNFFLLVLILFCIANSLFGKGIDHIKNEDQFLSTLNFQDIVINEFSASNDSLSGISDTEGEFDDWIEIFNNTDATVDLSNAFLTDNIENPEKWQFPQGTEIEAGSYLIVWADEDGEQEGLHANFKLSRSGEFIMLTEQNMVIDSLTYGEQTTNLTASRIPNGTGEFQIQEPTFMQNNENATSISKSIGGVKYIDIYPNPTSNYIVLDIELTEAKKVRFELVDLLGGHVLSFNQIPNTYNKGLHQLYMPLPDALNSGIYFLKMSIENELQTFKLIVEK